MPLGSDAVLRTLVPLIALACLAGLPAGCGSSGSPCGPTKGTVSRVIDGDTIELETGERIRYLNVDTPESTGGKDDCYGTEAAAFNAMLVGGRDVRLRYDVECTDRYDRLLAFVEVDNIQVNMRLVEQGYACVLIIPPNGQDTRDAFEDAEYEARQLGRGMWGVCDEVTCD